MQTLKEKRKAAIERAERAQWEDSKAKRTNSATRAEWKAATVAHIEHLRGLV